MSTKSVEEVGLTFWKVERSYHSTPNGWRLCTFEEAKNGLETIKEKKLLNKWDRVRLLDGWITGPGYNFEMGNDFRGCLGCMLLIQTEASGGAYSDVHLSDEGKEVALFLCADDWNYEVVYWLLNSWSNSESTNLRDVGGGNIPFSNVTKFKEMNKMIGQVARRLGVEIGKALEKAGKTKYSGKDSIKEVLSGMIKIVTKEDDVVQFMGRAMWQFIRYEGDEYCIPLSVQTGDVVEEYWNFVSESFGGYAVEVCARTGLKNILNMLTKSTCQMDLMAATSVLLHLSDFRSDIIHEPLAHNCKNSCAAKILQYAADKAAGDLDKFNEMLKNNAMWRSYNDTGNNYGVLGKLLFIVAQGKYARIGQGGNITSTVIDTLLKCGAPPQRPHAIGKYKMRTALHSVAKFWEEYVGAEVARALLRRCDEQSIYEFVNAADENGRTALHIASKKGNANICGLLLDHGASVTVQDKKGMTALHYALGGKIDKVINAISEVAETLLSRCDEQSIYEFVNAVDEKRRTALHCASEKGNVRMCELLIDCGALLTAQDPKGMTALHYAFEGGNVKDVGAVTETAQALLRSCDEQSIREFVNATDDKGRTALHRASEIGNIHICGQLLDRGALPTARDQKGMTALHYAFEGEIDKVKDVGIKIAHVLLRRCDSHSIFNFVNAKSETGRTALHGASEKGNVRICELLIDHGASVADQDNKGLTALHHVFEGKCDKDVSVMIENAQALLRNCDEKSKPDFVNARDERGRTALHGASEKGNARICELLVDHGALVTAQDLNRMTALHYAFEGIRKVGGVGIEIAQALLRRCDELCINKFVNVRDVRGRTALHGASEKGNAPICERLIHYGALVTAKDDEGLTALHHVFEGEVDKDVCVVTEIAQALLRKCDEQSMPDFVDARDKRGRTALHGASEKGNARICKLLIDHGASVTDQDLNGMTSLHYAFEGEIKKVTNVGTEIAEALLRRCDEHKISEFVNATDKRGRTALHSASEKGSAHICELLVDYGALVTARDVQGMTALHHVFEGETDKDVGVVTEIAEALLGMCDERSMYEFVNAVDEKGKTALHSASEKRNARICELLVSCGALVTAQDKRGMTALHCAFIGENRGNDKVIDVLVTCPHVFVDLKDKRGCTPIDMALINMDYESTAKLLLKSNGPKAYLEKALPNMDNNSTAQLLVKLRSPEAYFNEVDQKQLLRHSLRLGSVDIVYKLFEKGIRLPLGDYDEDGKTILHLAAMCDNESNAIEMISFKMRSETAGNSQAMVAKEDRTLRTVLHEAALKGHAFLCSGLLNLNPELIYKKDRDGRNPLHDAVEGEYKGTTLCMKLLDAYLKKERPDDDLMDRSCQTPLHVAASQGKAQLVKELLSSDKIKTRYLSRGDILSQTALHKAVKCGDIDTVEILLKHGAHPLRERDCDGRTALHYAVQAETGDKMELAQKLFERCESDKEKTLLLWASAAGLGTADQDLSKYHPLYKFLEDKKKVYSKGNLLQMAASLGDIEMTKELISRGYHIADIGDSESQADSSDENKENIQRVLGQIKMIKEQGNDKPAISDSLGRLDYAQGLAALFLNPYIKPPIAVGITGLWGMGKSSLMLQTERILLTTAAQMTLLQYSKLSSSVLPDIIPCKLSKQGKRKLEHIYRHIKHVEGVNRNIFVILWDYIKSSLKQPSVKKIHEKVDKFLNEYDHKYVKVFKALAAMDCSDMLQSNASQQKLDPSIEKNVPSVLTVKYNAWKYRNDTEALAGIAVEVTKELEGIMTKAQWLNTCWRNTWKKKKYTLWIEIFFPSLLALVLACSFTWIAWVVFDNDKLKEWGKVKYAWPPAALVIIVWTLTKSAMGILKPISSQLMQYISFPDHTDKLGYHERVISDISFLKDEIRKEAYWVFCFFAWVLTILTALWDLITDWGIISLLFHHGSHEKSIKAPKVAPASGSNLRIIVFVDDLDRCQESVILQVLSAVNLVLAECEISVVIGMDKRLIERAIRRKYKDVNANKSLKIDNQELANIYLQKIIQLPLDLPDPSKEESRSFLRGQLGVLENENTASTKGNRSSSSGGGESDAVQRNTAAQHTINMDPSSEMADMGTSAIGPANSRERSVSPRGEREVPLRTDRDATIAGNEKPSSYILIREMLFVRYSKGEERAFLYFQGLATDCRKLPREWKRLLNYHRLVWYILSVSKDAKDVDGWQVQLITWIFICWEWQACMDLVIEKWKEITIKTKAPSLLMIVTHLIEEHKVSICKNSENADKLANSMEKKLDALEKSLAELKKEIKELKEVVSDELKKDMKELEKHVHDEFEEDIKEVKEQIVKTEIGKNEGIQVKEQESVNNEEEQENVKTEDREQKEQIVKQKSGKNADKWSESWKRMKSTLEKYDVSMDGIQAFQRFRFYCRAGYLPRLTEDIENGSI